MAHKATEGELCLRIAQLALERNCEYKFSTEFRQEVDDHCVLKNLPVSVLLLKLDSMSKRL